MPDAPTLIGLLWVGLFLAAFLYNSRNRWLQWPVLWLYGKPVYDQSCVCCKRSWRIAGPFVECAKGICLCTECLDNCKKVLDAEISRTQRRPADSDANPLDQPPDSMVDKD